MGKTEKRSGQGSMADWFICQEIAQFQRAYGRGETLPASPPPAPPPEPLEEKWRLLEEAEPIDVLTFIESPQYLNKRDEIYDSAKWVLEIFYHPERHREELIAVGVPEEEFYFLCEHCQRKLLFEAVNIQDPHCPLCHRHLLCNVYFNEFVGFLGMRSIKSVCSAIIMLYEIYKLLCLPNPQRHYGLMSTTAIHATCCATAAAQASDTVYHYVKEFKRTSPWFQRYISALQELQKEYKIELYKETEAEFAFLNKNIFCNYMHSRSPGLHGVARKVMVIDEIARFDSTEGPRSAAKVYEAATTTTQSFRRHGIRACISAPEHATDMICERYAYAGVKFESPALAKIYTPLREIDGREIIPEPHTIGFHYATWELNPTQTWEVLEPLRNSDPDSFWKIFGAIPPAAREPYFMNVELVKRAFSADIPTPWDAYGRLRDDFRGNPRLRYVMHLDPGLGRPSRFGIAIGHAEPHPKPPSETETTLYVIDFVYAVEPDPETREISFERVYELIEELLNRFEVVVATTDRWNDVHLRQYLAKYVRTTTIETDHIEGLKNRAPKILQNEGDKIQELEAAMSINKTNGPEQKKVEPVARQSEDIRARRLEDLRRYFPEAFVEGKVDFDRLREALGEIVEDSPERYTFTWAGRREALRLLQMPTRATLEPCREESVAWETTQNVFIEGENLEVLKLLLRPYYGRVKMIYIDPPYNTGNDFIYRDDYRDPLGAYLKMTGQKDEAGNLLTSNPETSGRYHSAWLSMMYPRLFLARQLLREDGVIFVSIDDHEVHNLRMIMNEIFGEENFVVQIAWQSRQSIQNDTDISVNHEYILVYAKLRRQQERRLKESNAEVWETLPGFAAYPLPLSPDKFSNPDNDPRGPWKADPFDAPNKRPNLTYKIRNPNTGEEHLPPPGRCWRTDQATFERLLKEGRIVFGRSGDARPQLKVFYREKQPYGEVENSWFDGNSHGTTTHGTREVQELFKGRTIFESPKPSSLLCSLLRISTRRNDIILDFFAGSCTTAQAVLELNREDGGNRRFIMVQLPEPTPEGSAAREAGFKTIAEIGKERIRRVITRLKEQSQGQLDLPDRDLGFRVYKLACSHYRNWTGVEGQGEESPPPETYLQQMEMFVDTLADGWTLEGVIAEVALKEAGFGLNYRVESVESLEQRVYRVTDPDRGQTFNLCLDETVRLEAIKALGLDRDTLFVCRASALDDETAANLALQCRLKVI